MIKFERVWRAWTEWEEVKFNMWGEVADRKSAIESAIRFTSDHKLYGSFMRRIIKEWPASCENALTDYSLNRKAWIGHAAVALALQIPEDITRAAWARLTSEQQFLANEEARRAISSWENMYLENLKLRKEMGEQMLPGWDS